jgi:polysaccharide pyruvyl transferase WcaK-like protein
VRKDAKNILIFGGQFQNRGVQGLTFITIHGLKERYPEKDVFVLSSPDYYCSDGTERHYRFLFLPWDLEIKAWLRHDWGRHLRFLRGRSHPPELMKRVRDVFNDAACIVDVSGFSLSSLWPARVSLQYLLNIHIARFFGIPMYILPQSFGPFDSSLIQKAVVHPLMKRLLTYPKIIFARETDSLEAIHKFTRANVAPIRHLDMVLLNKKYDLEHIHSKTNSEKVPTTGPGAVGIVPNIRVMQRTHSGKLYRIYQNMIDTLLAAGKHVFLLSHAGKIDHEIAHRIKQDAGNKPHVYLLEPTLQVPEIEALIARFDFIITSRYHAGIHAYRNGIPALVLGWAPKYHAIMKEFNQTSYLFDIRSGLDRDGVQSSLGRMLLNWRQEKEIITTRMKELSILDNEDVFNAFDSAK